MKNRKGILNLKMDSGPKLSSARVHSARSACCGPAHATTRDLPDADRQPARTAQKTARPTRAQRPHDALEHARLTRQPVVRASATTVA
jgi:hypothetical protein